MNYRSEKRLTIYQKISRDWDYSPAGDLFIYRNGAFNVTRDLAQQKLKDMGKEKYPNAWILDALNALLKETA